MPHMQLLLLCGDHAMVGLSVLFSSFSIHIFATLALAATVFLIRELDVSCMDSVLTRGCYQCLWLQMASDNSSDTVTSWCAADGQARYYLNTWLLTLDYD